MTADTATISNGKLATPTVISIDAGSTFEEALNATNIALEQLAKAVIADQLPHHLFVELHEDPYSTDVEFRIGRLNSDRPLGCGNTDHPDDIADSLSEQHSDDLNETFGEALAADPGLCTRLSHLFHATVFLCCPVNSKVYHPAVEALLTEAKTKRLDPLRAAEINRTLALVAEKRLTVQQAEIAAAGHTLH